MQVSGTSIGMDFVTKAVHTARNTLTHPNHCSNWVMVIVQQQQIDEGMKSFRNLWKLLKIVFYKFYRIQFGKTQLFKISFRNLWNIGTSLENTDSNRAAVLLAGCLGLSLPVFWKDFRMHQSLLERNHKNVTTNCHNKSEQNQLHLPSCYLIPS